MLRSLFSGVSGMDANQEWIDTIGNDIANINTTGYKSNEVQFEDLLSQTIAGATAPTQTQGGVNPTQVGLGVKVAGIAANFTQGTSEQTGNPLDLAIQGDGFFVCNANGQTSYTRAGSLQLDANGDLVTPDGYLVQGWEADAAGAINTSAPLGNVSIPSGQSIAAKATTALSLGGNLAGQNGWTDPLGKGATGGASTSVTVYAANGATESLDLSFQPVTVSGTPVGYKGKDTPASEWQVEGVLTTPGATPDFTSSAVQPLDLYFDSNGTLMGTSDSKSTSTTSLTLTVADETSKSGTSVPFTLNVGGVTANASSDSLSVLGQDGNAPGTLQSYSIGSDGVIQGVFSNGQTLNLGQIALATFANPDGLQRSGDSNFLSTANSGLAQVGPPDNGSRGSVQAGSLEASNVDLASEMTNLIEAQTGFQASGKVITTSDELLQDLMQLKQ